MSTEWQRFELSIPVEYTKQEREAIAQEVIDFIVDRTQKKNVDWKGKPLPPYSDSYKKSLDFKNAGKSPGDVNFTQSGDTIASIELLENKKGKLVIGWENGSEANAIADGNIRGTYGNDKAVGPKRDILGIQDKDLQRILNQFPLNEPDELDSKINEYLFAKDKSRGEG